MILPLRAHLALAAVALSGVVLVATGWTAFDPPPLGRSVTAPDTAERLAVSVAGLGLVLVGVWCLGVALVCATDLLRRRTDRGTGFWRPRPVRALMLRACVPTVGAALLCGSAPAVAAPRTPTPQPEPAPHGASALVGLPLPTRPVSKVPATGAATAAPRVILRTVGPGDCLWDIAADLLGERPAAADVDRAWRVLYRTNRSRVGPDPDLLRQGTRLVVPPSLHPSPHRHR